MTASAWRGTGMVGLFSVVAVVLACAQEAPSATVHVALGLERARTANPAPSLASGRTVGVVCFDVSPPTTVVAADAGVMVDAFRAALASGEFPVETAAQVVALPAPAAHDGGACDIALFDDVDGDAAWDPGEPYFLAWSGGRGGYRLVALSEPRTDQSGAQAGWNLVEGGVPPTYTGVPSDVVVVIEPVIEQVRAH